MFHFVTRSLEILLKFWAPKAAFRRNSVIIDFLVNKLIFSQTKYGVICFTLKPSQPENMSRIFFLAVAAIFWKCLIFGAVNKTWIGIQIELVFSLLVHHKTYFKFVWSQWTPLTGYLKANLKTVSSPQCPLSQKDHGPLSWGGHKIN